MIRIKNKNTNMTLVSILLFLVSGIIGIIDNNHCEFFIVTLSLCFIIKKAKVSYFSVFSFIMWFGFLQEYFASIDLGLASGRLMIDTSVSIYMCELYACMMILFLLELMIINSTNFLKMERELYRKKVPIRKYMAYIYATGAFLLVFLAYPSAPSLHSVLARDNGYISSSLVVPIAVLLLSIIYDYLINSLYQFGIGYFQ